MDQTLICRADTTNQIGSGHVMRCIAFAQAWRARGGDVIFIALCRNKILQQRICDDGINLVLVRQQYPNPADLRQTLDQLYNSQKNGFRPWFVLDGYHFQPEYQKSLRAAGCRLVILDDMAHLSHYHTDIIVNQNIHASRLTYNCSPETIKLLGSKYVLLRREFLQSKGPERKIADKAKKILVTFGASDPDNVSLKAVMALNAIGDSDLKVKILLGPDNPNEKSIRRTLDGSAFSFHVLQAVKSMPELMHWADLVISAAGSTCWELSFLGVPSMVITTAENQKGIGEELDRQNAAIHAGSHRDLDINGLASMLTEVIHDGELRSAMNISGKQLVDGRGSERILSFIQFLDGENISVENNLRPAENKDCLSLWELANDPSVRKNSFSSHSIPLETHKKWYRHKLKSDISIMVVLDVSGVIAGQIRYDKIDRNCAEVHFAIHPMFRGQGLGRKIILATWQKACQDLGVCCVQGVVKHLNKASVHSFLKAGFDHAGDFTESGQKCLTFERKFNGGEVVINA